MTDTAETIALKAELAVAAGLIASLREDAQVLRQQLARQKMEHRNLEAFLRRDQESALYIHLSINDQHIYRIIPNHEITRAGRSAIGLIGNYAQELFYKLTKQ
jgi:hypothetical protein